MNIVTTCIRLGIVTAALGAAVTVPVAQADPTPEPAADACSASNLAETISKVNHDISQYLVAHPDTNQALTDVAKQTPFAAQSAFSSYFDAHPQEAADLHAIQQPLTDLSNQCGFQVTAGQVLSVLGDL